MLSKLFSNTVDKKVGEKKTEKDINLEAMQQAIDKREKEKKEKEEKAKKDQEK